MADNFYIFEKGYDGKRILLGEIQSNFNMSFVIDGTKDSAKVEVIGFQESEIEPYTICWHEKTNTWWVVSNDKVERLMNEHNDFVYIHSLKLLGAVELLNARDLTDCGFNDKTYNVNQFITRLFSLSAFEYNLNFISPMFELNNKVEFVKTFENYTLLSAIREILDTFNMSPKLYFNPTQVGGDYYLRNAVLSIVSKTGDTNYIYQENFFDDVRETKTMDKNSFGSTVVSNAQNVISSIDKTYPSTGSVKLSATEYDVKPNNAIIRLPSNIYKANWVKMIYPLVVNIKTYTQADGYKQVVYAYNDNSATNFINFVKSKINSDYNQTNAETILASINFDNLIETIKKASTTTFWNNDKINPVTAQIIKGDIPYIPKPIYESGSQTNSHEVILTDKETRECLKSTFQGIYWERGKSTISGFDFLASARITSRQDTDLQGSGSTIVSVATTGEGTFKIEFYRPDQQESADMFHILSVAGTSFIVNYIPMGDLKIKLDNTRNRIDMQLYNQTGKLSDSIALSKLINSYSKEISGDTITKYKSIYGYSSVPQVGSIVQIDNIDYVINNVSLDFLQNENEEYYIVGEFTMSIKTSTKSLLVNPDTNIRDYGIPQNFNVKRKQVYRDYWELTYNSAYDDANLETPYLQPQKVFLLGHLPTQPNNYICVIELVYDERVEGSYSWYYQLETTNYLLQKMLYVVLDFNDNNIIGYGSQNVFSGFDITRVFTGMTDLLNTPISYVDENGKVKDINISFLTNDQITAIYYNYQINQTNGSSYEGSLYNYSVFIPAEIYTGDDLATYPYEGAKDVCEFAINETNYNKDAIEVPVFEYICQIDDSENVLIGDNILMQYDDIYIYFYTYKVYDHATQESVFDEQYPIIDSGEIYMNNTVEFNVNNQLITFNFYARTTYNTSSGAFTNTTSQSPTANKDIAIFRHAFNLATAKQSVDLMMIMKNKPANISRLYLNHYKLK